MTVFIGTFVMSSFTAIFCVWATAGAPHRNTARIRVIRHFICLILKFFISLLI